MSDDKSKGLDIFGIKPIAETIHTVTKASLEAAGAFLSRICLPAAEELGLMLRDKVSNWRAKNALAIVQKAEQKLLNQKGTQCHAHPRLVIATIEHGSWTDDASVQEMWARTYRVASCILLFEYIYQNTRCDPDDSPSFTTPPINSSGNYLLHGQQNSN